MLLPGIIWFTGQLKGLGYHKTLREAVCPPSRVYRGSSLLQPMTPNLVPASTLLLHPFPPPFLFVFKVEIGVLSGQAWKYTGGTQ